MKPVSQTIVRVAAIALVAAAVAVPVAPVGANPAAALPENPWHRITDFELDEDHGYMARSPFDAMSEAQLASVPRGNRIHYNAPSKCVPARLKNALAEVSARFGPITVNSTVRSASANRKAGGRKKSYHLSCAAVDFRVHGSTKGLMTWLRKHPSVGGYKRYSSGFYHIDTGPKRTW